jgi:hypothetical protein
MNKDMSFSKEKVAIFCRKWGVRELSLFGSVLRDDFRPDSDIDILVEIEPSRGLTAWDWVDMVEELKSLFGREVDLVEKSAIRNPFRRRQILSTSKVVYA